MRLWISCLRHLNIHIPFKTLKEYEMIRIYNHTDRNCFDDKKIYFIAG